MAELGYWAIAFTFLVSLYVGVVSIIGGQRALSIRLQSAWNGILVALVSSTLAVGILLVLLMQRDYSVRYVYEHTSNYLSNWYAISAIWAGQEGSLLIWLWFLVLMSAVIVLQQRKRPAAYDSYVLAVMAWTQAFLALILLLVSDPFVRLPIAPVEGRGLNPLLQNAWMVVHPPIVFIGYAAYTVPFALALGALITGEYNKEWLAGMRRWSLWAWLFLGAGILAGARWAYVELSWGGYWGWDPVENSSLVPWLTGTALLHSLMMQQRRGTFIKWNLWLASLTFTLCLFATFVTRSGLIRSIHAFGESSLGYYFLGFIFLSLAVLAYLLHRRQQEVVAHQDLKTLLSREASLLLTNLLFVGMGAILLLGILFPSFMELLRGREASLGIEFYERTISPLAMVVVLLMGICPWLVWGGSTSDRLWRKLFPGIVAALAVVPLVLLLGAGQALAVPSFAMSGFVLVSIVTVGYRGVEARRRIRDENPLSALLTLASRDRRKYGGHLVHLGIALMAIGITGSSLYQREVQMSMAQGEEIEFAGYTLQYRRAFDDEDGLRYRIGVEMDVSRGNTRIGTLVPKKDLHWSTNQWKTEVAVRSTFREDLYIILASIEQDGLATFRLLLNPLVMWLWIGSVLLMAGGIVAWWPFTTGRRRA
jgi:cytochrome c-type biogenesis protein CcmF